MNGIDLSSTTDEELIMKATKNLVGSLGDKYTRILDKSAYAMIQKYDLIGVGATLMPNPTTKEIVIGSPPVPKSAGYEAGLKMGDVILAIDGVSTMGYTIDDFNEQMQIEEMPYEIIDECHKMMKQLYDHLVIVAIM